MSQVHANPDDLREFAARLQACGENIAEEASATSAAFAALGDTWNDAQRAEFDVAKRHDICRRVDRILTEACPYVLLWNADSTRLLYWNRFGVPPTVLSKYGREDGALAYWWYDPDAAEDLADAMATGRSLPRRAPEVRFDEAFAGERPEP